MGDSFLLECYHLKTAYRSTYHRPSLPLLHQVTSSIRAARKSNIIWVDVLAEISEIMSVTLTIL
jgi:hypothetical protein